MRRAGFEPTTFGSGGQRSIQLSYRRKPQISVNQRASALSVEIGARGFEPPTSWSRTRRANRTALRPETDFHAPRGTRTPSLLVRSQTLYPIELWARNGGSPWAVQDSNL